MSSIPGGDVFGLRGTERILGGPARSMAQQPGAQQSQPAPGLPSETEVDPRFEFDAPRFYDFNASSPADSPPDHWFSTSATKGTSRWGRGPQWAFDRVSHLSGGRDAVHAHPPVLAHSPVHSPTQTSPSHVALSVGVLLHAGLCTPEDEDAKPAAGEGCAGVGAPHSSKATSAQKASPRGCTGTPPVVGSVHYAVSHHLTCDMDTVEKEKGRVFCWDQINEAIASVPDQACSPHSSSANPVLTTAPGIPAAHAACFQRLHRARRCWRARRRATRAAGPADQRRAGAAEVRSRHNRGW